MTIAPTLTPILELMQAQGRTEEELALVRRAYTFAAKAHAGQKRKSGDPYITHPLATALRIAELKLDDETIAASLLHDVCEDTPNTRDALKKQFGEEIAFLVEGVTKLDRLRYRGVERSAESLRKMFLAIAEDIRIVLIKLVDRLHNMHTLGFLPPEKQKRIALETLEIYAPLANRLGIGELRSQLEDLAFPYVYPKEHAWLMTALKDHFEDRKHYVERVKPVVAQNLQNAGIQFLGLDARAKHSYSLYKKLLRYDMDIEKVSDLIALRIIVPTIEDCYATLGIIHNLWTPLAEQMKDYIAVPKPNGYRSLHTTVVGPEEKMVEFQIRTPEMQTEAENGIAAHWAYTEKKGGAGYRKREASFAASHELHWIEQLREWQKEFKRPEEFVESLKIDFLRDRIFVLTPKGDVINLPEGATPVDFAYAVHTDIGATASGARVNGKMVALDYELRNGETVEIITQKNKKPSRDWMTFVKTSQARKKISAFWRRSEETGLFEKRGGETVELRATVRERIGILREISSVFARQKIPMKSVVTESKNRLYPVLVIHAVFKNRTDLERLITRMREVKGVEEINYKLR